MALKNIREEEFTEQLYSVISPSQPITSIELLSGRTREMQRVKRALIVPGKSVFIHGERGVGKSSLASTAAQIYQSSDKPYIDVSCQSDTTILSLVSNIAMQATNQYKFEGIVKKINASVNLRFFKTGVEKTISRSSIQKQLSTIGDAIELLKEISLIYSEKTVCVVDEIEKITDEVELEKLADLIKGLGDKKVSIKFIFTAVGQTLESILGANASTIRQLETIHLPRLSWDARWDIAINALHKFDVEIKEEIYIRLAAVSDGFPHYVHLITDKLLWILFDKETVVHEVTWDDYSHALDATIECIEADLARPYIKAVEHRADAYEEVLWSTSIVEWQGADLSSMYSEYENILNQRPNSTKLTYEQFCTRIRNLKQEKYGKILKQGRQPGHYMYEEKILRGYVRMQAEANNVEILNESQEAEIKQYITVSSRKTGYFGSKPPKDWDSNKAINPIVLSAAPKGNFRRDKVIKRKE
ncbi:AAA family ATPase [Paraglaciecola chathamensis]|uniref:Archaeal ATPase family n=1 Tax=Paraglaciecola agarilytica NO2 TaxID=1125747 RepID=A0ABQ0I3F5_9ALTE|nr:ATP-binding protein [Paraglaciecola agarilytica]GAC03797.1 archaeal ATPase family [Paraglaciecola agarilytica NO2]